MARDEVARRAICHLDPQSFAVVSRVHYLLTVLVPSPLTVELLTLHIITMNSRKSQR